MKQLIVSFLAFCLFFIPFCFAVTVEIPGDSVVARDVNVPGATIEWDSNSIINLIQQINEYLRFSLAAICMGVAIYAWYNIIMTWWDKAKIKKWNQTLVGALVGIVISVFSYVLVRLVVNLF